MLEFSQLVRLIERSAVWHLVGDLVRQVDGSVLVVGLVALLVVTWVARSQHLWPAQPAIQRHIATVHCACGRQWTVRS